MPKFVTTPHKLRAIISSALTHTFAKLKPLRSLTLLLRASLRQHRIVLRKQAFQRLYPQSRQYRSSFTTMATLDDGVKSLISKSYPQAGDIDSDPVKVSSTIFGSAEVCV